MSVGVLPLSEIAEINPPLGISLANDAEVSFIPMGAFSDVTASVVAEETRQYGAVKKGFTCFRNGDVLFAKITPCFENGKIGMANLSRPVGFGSTEFHVIRAKPGKADPRFLHHFLRQQSVRTGGVKRMTGSAGQRRVPRAFLETLAVPSHALGEQRRIAAILDHTEELRTKRRAAIALLNQLPQAIFLEMFGDPTSNPMKWPTIDLGKSATFVGGGTPSRARAEYFTGTICWATSKDMKGTFLDDTQEHVTQRAIDESAAKLVPAGTILIVVKSKILMHHLPVALARVPLCFGQDLKGIRTNDNADTIFVLESLRINKRWLLERARGINTEGLTLDHLRAFPLLDVPLDQQQLFAARIKEVERQKEVQLKALFNLDALVSSLQATLLGDSNG